MNMTATIIAQGFTFLFFILATMKLAWGPVTKAMAERKQRIADGLAAAERSQRELAEAQTQVGGLIKQAREQAAEILAQANARSAQLLDEAKANARAEGERIVAAARAQVAQEVGQAREALRREVATLAVAGAARILQREIDGKAHAQLLDEVARQLN